MQHAFVFVVAQPVRVNMADAARMMAQRMVTGFMRNKLTLPSEERYSFAWPQADYVASTGNQHSEVVARASAPEKELALP